MRYLLEDWKFSASDLGAECVALVGQCPQHTPVRRQGGAEGEVAERRDHQGREISPQKELAHVTVLEPQPLRDLGEVVHECLLLVEEHLPRCPFELQHTRRKFM